MLNQRDCRRPDKIFFSLGKGKNSGIGLDLECMLGVARQWPFPTLKIVSQSQMYVMEYCHEVDEHSLILTKDVVNDNICFSFFLFLLYYIFREYRPVILCTPAPWFVQLKYTKNTQLRIVCVLLVVLATTRLLLLIHICFQFFILETHVLSPVQWVVLR